EVTQPRPWHDQNPDFDPERGVTLSFATPVSFREVREGLSFAPAIALPAGIEARDGSVSTQHTLALPLQPETNYTVIVQNINDAFGQTLARAQRSFRTRPLQPRLRSHAGVFYVEANARPTVPVRVTNLETVRLGMERLRPDQVVPSIRLYD